MYMSESIECLGRCDRVILSLERESDWFILLLLIIIIIGPNNYNSSDDNNNNIHSSSMSSSSSSSKLESFLNKSWSFDLDISLSRD